MAAREAGDAVLDANVDPDLGGRGEDLDPDSADGDRLMLSFHEEIVDELLEQDGLTVMAEGLGLSETLAGIIRALPRATASPKASDSALVTLLLPSRHSRPSLIRSISTSPTAISLASASPAPSDCGPSIAEAYCRGGDGDGTQDGGVAEPITDLPAKAPCPRPAQHARTHKWQEAP